MIKFFDLRRQDKVVHKKIINEIKKNIQRGDFILGSKVNEFEKKFATFCKAKYAIGCANGTDALTISLKALNLPKNSEVIIPAMTFCSTAYAVINAGLKPVLVDINNKNPTLSILELKKKINNKTRVIMPVHLYGSVVDINSIKKIISRKKITIIDDCSQAHGAYDYTKKNNKKIIGSYGDISCFSLYPGKNLGAYGDAGIITTNNEKYYKVIKKLRNLGSEKKFDHELVGFNSRLDSIQSIVLIQKLKYLNKLNDKRRDIANYYNEKIHNNNVDKLNYSKNAVYHQYVILVKNRQKLIKLFKKKKVQFGFHYPSPIHKLRSLRNSFKKEKYINAERLAKKGISIPIDPFLKNNEVKKIVTIINSL